MKTPVQSFGVLLLASLLSSSPALSAQEKAAAPIQQWIEQLGAEEHAERQAAEKHLLGLGSKAKAALNKAAKQSGDPEVQWRARRLLRKLERQGKGKSASGLSPRAEKRPGESADQAPPAGTGRPQLGEIERIMDRFRGQLEDFDGFDRDLERAMRELRASMRELREMQKGLGELPRAAAPGIENRRSMSIKQGPDGVRVEVVERGKDGKEQRKVYEAEDMESFKQKHPGVLKENGLIFGVRPGLGLEPGRLQRLFGGRDGIKLPAPMRPPIIHELRPRAGQGQVLPADDGPKLGVYIGQVDPAVRAYLELDSGRGLMVDQVAPASDAAKLGVRAGDILLELNGVELFAIPDVRRGLERGKDGEMALELIRKGRRMTLGSKAKVTKPEAGGLKKKRQIR